MLHRRLIVAGLLAMFGGTSQAGDWPAFRGPLGTGISSEKDLPTTWGPDENIKWKAPLEGFGNSSPIVSRGRVFVTAATDRGSRRSLYCFDRKDGKELWAQTVGYQAGAVTHKSNQYCASTPAADGKLVVVWHGSAGLYCYNFDGNPIWSKDLGAASHIWGYASSPVIYRDRVLLHFGPGVDTFMTAVDLKTGETIWKTDEPGGANSRKPRMVGSWSTPVIAQVDGRDQLICSMPTRVVAYDPETGSILWTVGGLPSPRGDLVYTSPLISGGVGVAMGGFMGPALAFKLGGSGDVTRSNRLWHAEKKQPQRIGSGVIVGKHIFMANAGPGTAQCIELETGKVIWQERLEANHWGSLVLADGRLYVTDQKGTTTVFRPNPEKFEPIASNKLGEPTNATPAFSDGEIFIRTNNQKNGHLFCIEK